MNLRRLLVVALIALSVWFAASPVSASALTRDEIQKYFPPPLMIGQEDDKLPIWPVLKQGSGTWDVIAYVFQSNDFAPIPGFGGSLPNLLIAISPEGTFIDVKVLAQHEPVFVDGLGEGPLNDFVQQYVGMSARHTICVGRPNARAKGASPTSVVDGVAMATASTRVINQELLSSAPNAGRPASSARSNAAMAPSRKNGTIDYPECFQCMDCVTIIHNPTQCVPQILAAKKGKVLEPQLVAAE